MAFPADVKLVSVTCGTGYDFSGEPISITLEVTPVLGGNLKRLIHAATGTFMTRDALTFKSDPGSPATFTVPSPAQAETWKDGSGAFFTNWSYSVTVTTRTASGKTQSWIQSFQPVDGQETVDLDLVPDGQIGSPTSAPAPAVTSVNGQSGAVVIDAGEAVTPESVAANLTVDAVDAKLPERLTESALSAAIDGSTTQKMIDGGRFPKPVRAPVLGIRDSWPNPAVPYFPAWIDGATTYAYAPDSMLRKSVDGGKTWTPCGYNAWGFGSYGCFLKLASGTLLNIIGGSPAQIQRSTNDGATWSFVHQFRTNTVPLGSQSWAVDGSGNIWMGEYFTNSTDEIRLWKSSDDGATWQTVYTWPGALTPDGTARRIRHIHSVQWDPYMGRIIISTGDSTPDTGLWRVTADGNSAEPLLTNSMLPVSQMDVPRSIGIMPFPDYIAWAGDTSLNPYVSRMARSEIGKANPVVEQVYKLNGTAWFSVRASAAGDKWVISASQEIPSIDKSAHLYSVEDQGATVWEIGAIPAPTSGVASFMPLGLPAQGDVFHMTTRGFPKPLTFAFQLGYGFTRITPPAPLPDVLVPQSANSGLVTLAPGESKVFHIASAGALIRRFHIMEAGCFGIDTGGTVGTLFLEVRARATGTVIYSTQLQSERYTKRLDHAHSIWNSVRTNGELLEFALKNTHAGVTITATGNVTFGWGLP